MDDILIGTAMYAMCHRPGFYVRGKTAAELVDYINNDEFSRIVIKEWETFYKECLSAKDLAGLSNLDLWEIWKEWAGDTSPQPSKSSGKLLMRNVC